MNFFERIKGNIKSAGPCFPVLAAALVLTGCFIETFSCVIAAALSGVLIYLAVKNKGLRMRFSASFIAVLLIALFSLLTAFYGVDGGESLIGFVRFLPVVLFAVLLMQDALYAESLLTLLPGTAAALGLLSLALSAVPALGFTVKGRLGGFFQYPNTYAMLMLIGELLILEKPKKTVPDIVCAAVLFVLVICTGSRAVFVLGVVFSFILLFMRAEKRGRIILAASAGTLIAACVLLYPLLKNVELLNRFFSLSVFESTFAGRLLYWRDSLTLILNHPFGMGYLGYSFVGQSVQTGVYTVRFVHNDILQLMLDVGWAPVIALLIAVFKKLFSKKTDAARRLILIAYLFHICFDFDLQYAAMWFVLLLLLDDGHVAQRTVKKSAAAVTAAAAGMLSLYFAAALGLGFFGAHEASLALYPLNTQERITVLTQTEDEKEMRAQADAILSRNEYVQVAYSAKAKLAFADGDVEQMMTYKHKVFELAPYDYDEYEDYATMLIYCTELYRRSGDYDSVKVCRSELIDTRARLRQLGDRTGSLGRIIADQPQTAFSDEIEAYIDSLPQM